MTFHEWCLAPWTRPRRTAGRLTEEHCWKNIVSLEERILWLAARRENMADCLKGPHLKAEPAPDIIALIEAKRTERAQEEAERAARAAKLKARIREPTSADHRRSPGAGSPYRDGHLRGRLSGLVFAEENPAKRATAIRSYFRQIAEFLERDEMTSVTAKNLLTFKKIS